MVRVCRVVPKDWTRFSPIGNVIPRTRFIVFKTPLNERLGQRVPAECRFTVNDLFRKLAERNQRLGLISPECLSNTRKSTVRAEDSLSETNASNPSTKPSKNYIENCADEDALIGIHCTNGINRSGYLICRFLIENLGWSSHEALEAFEQARGYPIEKGAYVMALHKAAKDVRNRKIDSDSDSSDRRRKSKKSKRKHRDMEDSVGEMPTDALSGFLEVLGQQASQLGAVSSPYNYPSANVSINGSYSEDVTVQQQQHWAYVNKKSKYQSTTAAAVRQQTVKQIGTPGSNSASPQESPYVEDEEGDDGEEEYEMVEGQTTAAKRRKRRHRMAKMLAVMKRGNFHEIQEMQAQFAGTHGALAK
ncbi:unnamed protein product [Caenorhabditis auriculariae]|uniref:Tyrosine specific protein phosphatases domain-containing protein n=1 Tax=Caenorhabditis auriculariae TaxID=2777116 RepID=A0A8S1HQ95_9PELO|nr:unnamed protein product [Caenorhabditis auriculariae]